MLYSTDEIWRESDEERCLSDDLNAIESDIAGKADEDHTHDGFAAADHEHTGYASSDHTHDGFAAADHEHTGYASTDHAHSDYAASGHTHSEYAPVSHEHTGYASSDHSHSDYAPVSHSHDYAAGDHTHTPAAIGAAPAAHSHDYAAPTHSHAQSDISGLEAALAAKAPNSALTAKADLVDGKVPVSQLPGYVSDVAEYSNRASFPANGESGKIYVAQDTNKTYRWSGTGYIEIGSSLALGETSATAYRGDRGKIAYDHSQNGDVHVTAAQKAAWDGKAAANHSHTPADIGAAPASHSHDYAADDHSHTPADIGAAPASHSHSGYAPSNHSHSGYAASGHSHNEYAPASHSHSGYAASGHTHNYAAANHKHTEHSGDITIQKTGGPGINLEATATGVKSRIHKNASATADYGTIISDYAADGKRDYLTIRRSSPSMGNKLLLNMEDANGGATKIYQIYGEHNKPGVLWNGAVYLNAGQTVTPSKKLSECRTGWMLLWSDYDADDGTVNDGDFCTTIIPRISPTGAAWAGKSFYCDIPRYIGSNQEDLTTESRIIKMIYIHDDKIVGHAANNKGVRTDVVLRAVYEF